MHIRVLAGTVTFVTAFPCAVDDPMCVEKAKASARSVILRD